MSTVEQPSALPDDEHTAPAPAEEQAPIAGARESEHPLPGASLLAERRAQGLSLGDVARQLKLSIRQIEALERDDYGSFPGPVFVRGFLRNYAKLLHLDADSIVELAQLPSGAETAATEAPAPLKLAKRSSRVPLVGGVLVLVILFGVMIALRGGKERSHERSAQVSAPSMTGGAVSPQHADSPPPSSPQVAAPPAGAAQAAPGEVAVHPGQAAPASVAASAVTPAVAVAPAAAGATQAVSAAPSPAVAPAPGGSPPPAAVSAAKPEQAEVGLAFEDDSWVEIKDASGSVVFSQLSQSGSHRTVRGAPPLSLVIGNAHGVKLTYRGKAVDLGPHTKVDVARLVLE
jgi:cytoskeleton protein RodZ